MLGSSWGTQLHRDVRSWRRIAGIPPGCPAPQGRGELERGHWGPARVPSSIGDRSLSSAAGRLAHTGGFSGSKREVAVGTFGALSTRISVALPIPALSRRLD